MPAPRAVSASSVSLTTSTSSSSSTSGATRRAGALFKMVWQPAARARASSAACWAGSVSICSSTVWAWASVASLTRSLRRARLAPGATTIWFSPLASTTMPAHPVGAASHCTCARSTPAAARRARAGSAKASRPTAAAIVTGTPKRRAAWAWLPPLPPGETRYPEPITVSPARGRRSALKAMSRLMEPKTRSMRVNVACRHAHDCFAGHPGPL